MAMAIANKNNINCENHTKEYLSLSYCFWFVTISGGWLAIPPHPVNDDDDDDDEDDDDDHNNDDHDDDEHDNGDHDDDDDHDGDVDVQHCTL